MAYQHPLHYLLGLEGAALLRAYAGDHDRSFAEQRVAEIRRLVADPAFDTEGVYAAGIDPTSGYRVWSATYDKPGNGLFPYEEPFVHDVVGALKPGVALDAACGTGRHSAHLAALGHHVIGVDGSPEMLALARTRLPSASFRLGALTRLPLCDDQADLAVCALALSHLPELDAAFAEFARVLRPGGHLVVTDVHHETVALGSVPHVRAADGSARLIPAHRHRASDYLSAALAHGFSVRRFEEPRRTAEIAAGPAASETGEWDGWPWSLSAMIPEAAAAAWSDARITTLWHFQSGEPA